MSRAANGRRARAVALLSLLVGLSVDCRPRVKPAPSGGPLEWTPQSAAFELPFGGETTEEFHLTGAGASDANLRVASGGDPDLRVQTLPAGGGVTAGLRIRAAGRAVGVRVGTLLIATGLATTPQVPLLFAVRVRGTMRVVPTNPMIDLGQRGVPATVIDVGSPRADFAVSAVEIVRGPFAATFHRAPGGATTFTITVTAQVATLPKDTRGAVGALVIVSNDQAEPRKEIPLFAFGARPR